MEESNFPVAGGLALIRSIIGPPEPYNKFSQNWLKFISLNWMKVVKTIKATPMAHAPDGVLSEEWLDGWDVADPGYPQDGIYFPQKGECASWVPADWLIPIPDQFSCNCAIQQIMTRGCSISWHQ